MERLGWMGRSALEGKCKTAVILLDLEHIPVPQVCISEARPVPVSICASVRDRNYKSATLTPVAFLEHKEGA